jgi:Recombinase
LVYDRAQGLMLEPDAQIQGAVRLLFATFRRTGSAEQVVRHFAREGLRWPRRLTTGPRAGEVGWGRLEHSRVLDILHNPRYAGAFVYGRRRQRKVGVTGQPRYRRLPQAEWKVFLPNAHPGYLSWEEFETNQATLRANAQSRGLDRRRSPAREGVALLQGLVLCGRCGERMTVRYIVRQGHPAPDYFCQRAGIATAQRICAQVDRAREEAELAQRQFLLVRPEHRLVADSLERQWNEALMRLAAAEEEYRRATTAEAPAFTGDDRARIHALVSDLPRVWHVIRGRRCGSGSGCSGC